MQARDAAQKYSDFLFWNDVFTALYMLLLMGFLYYTNIFLNIGRFDNVGVVFGLAGAEVFKYGVACALKSKLTNNKSFVKNLMKCSFMLLLTFIVIYVTAVLFGAPVFSNFQETCMFSSIVMTITSLPICLHLGPENAGDMFLSLMAYEGDSIQNLFMLKLRLALFGAWLGSFVIPLDWNRPWQGWPIPSTMAALLGYALAHCYCAVYHFKNQKKRARKTGKYTL